jgi:subtilisin-like proprotein convertase family protein
MLSVNPELSAQEVRQILMTTANRDLDIVLDLAEDPNIQNLSGEFNNGHSLFFGAGKVNAYRAVRRARALREGEPAPEPPPGETPGEARKLSIGTKANFSIPDNQPEGVKSHIEVCTSGRLADISVDVDITHSYRGDLNVTLISPAGSTAKLHRMTGGGEPDLKRRYTTADTSDLADFVASGIDVRGQWSLHVSDNLNRDVGRLNTWFLELRIV